MVRIAVLRALSAKRLIRTRLVYHSTTIEFMFQTLSNVLSDGKLSFPAKFRGPWSKPRP